MPKIEPRIRNDDDHRGKKASRRDLVIPSVVDDFARADWRRGVLTRAGIILLIERESSAPDAIKRRVVVVAVAVVRFSGNGTDISAFTPLERRTATLRERRG